MYVVHDVFRFRQICNWCWKNGINGSGEWLSVGAKALEKSRGGCRREEEEEEEEEREIHYGHETIKGGERMKKSKSEVFCLQNETFFGKSCNLFFRIYSL